MGKRKKKEKGKRRHIRAREEMEVQHKEERRNDEVGRGLKGEKRATENLIKKENNRRAEKDKKRTESRKV